MTEVDDKARKAEAKEYERIYANVENYAMGNLRKKLAQGDLRSVTVRNGYLDVGCGRGEMLFYAGELGFRPVRGVEGAANLCDGEQVIQAYADDLPFGDDQFDVVASWDVIEHLLPGDDESLCREMQRVARYHCFITANNQSSQSLGKELHINRRPYDEWHDLFTEWFDEAKRIDRLGIRSGISETWRIDL